MNRTTRTTTRRAPPRKGHWFHAEEGQVHAQVFDYVAQVERAQWDTFDRFVKLEVLYDPNSQAGAGSGGGSDTPGLVIENVIASCVDTVTASIAATDVRPRFLTDDGGWTTQRTAKRLEWYAEGLGKLLKINDACQRAFKSAAKKGTGIVKAYVDQFDEVKVEHVRIDDLIVDEAECRNGATPRQMHRRMTNVDREELKSMFPDSIDAIEKAQTGRGWSRGTWAGYRPLVDDELVVIESHKLPIGRKKRAGYVPGRHTITIDGHDLLDEEWHKPFFPYVAMTWSEREGAFYGISLAEGIAGIQRALNKRNLQIDRNLDQYAFPTTYVSMADAGLAVQTINRAGSIVPIKGERPLTVIPTAVSPEVYQNRNDMKTAAYENSGVSRMGASAVKPTGIDSGVGLREFRDQATQRFAIQEEAFELFVLDVYTLAIDCCKDLGDDAPVIMRKARFGAKRLSWKDVDMQDVRVQIAAASTLGRGPAGRAQTALEWAQAGIITTDEFRDLTQHPDLERTLSRYTETMRAAEEDIEAIEDGYVVSPEPFGNLDMMIRVGTAAYLRNRRVGDADGDDVCPEEILESIRDYVVLAAHMQAPPEMPGAMPAGPGAMPDPAMAQQPVAALAPQAMELRAG